MDIYLLRVAEKEKVSILHPDFHTCPLSQAGRETTQLAAETMAECVGPHGGFDRILSSTLTAARDSAEIMADCTDHPHDLEILEIMDGIDLPESVYAYIMRFNYINRCLLVADAPFINDLLVYLLTRDQDCRVRMAPGSIAMIEATQPHNGSGILHWIVPGFIW